MKVWSCRYVHILNKKSAIDIYYIHACNEG